MKRTPRSLPLVSGSSKEKGVIFAGRDAAIATVVVDLGSDLLLCLLAKECDDGPLADNNFDDFCWGGGLHKSGSDAHARRRSGGGRRQSRRARGDACRLAALLGDSADHTR